MSVYFVRDRCCGSIKIGYTSDSDATQRLAHLQTASPHELQLIGVIAGELSDEAELHKRFAAHRVRGEWFRPHDSVTDAIWSLLAADGKSVEFSELTPSELEAIGDRRLDILALLTRAIAAARRGDRSEVSRRCADAILLALDGKPRPTMFSAPDGGT